MKKILFLVLLMAWSFEGFLQPMAGDQPGADCHADFSATPEPSDPMTIHFQDLSTGQITNWQWSFGDGVTSSVQNPVHTYPAGGTYFACLTIYNSDPGLICHDMICIAITIHEPGQCVADYQYSTDNANRLRVLFTDKSSGTIDGWHWDFGDGTVSGEQNPTHIFPDYGKYKVCLTAYNISSPSTCSDIKCDSVEVKIIADCHASFDYVLDTMNQAPNTFVFNDRSTGNANSFQWTFDDGAIVNGRNAVHQFSTQGNHKVCQIISHYEQGNLLCRDSSCAMVPTASYLNLGGHLFTGKYPINNPVPSGDTGIAYIYRLTGTELRPFDTLRFTHLGYFSFPQILTGKYIIRAELSGGSKNYSNYFPSYYPDDFLWIGSQGITLADSNIFKANIDMKPVKIIPVGSGIIKGSVILALNGQTNNPVPETEVLLYGGDLVPLSYTKTDNNGHFEFTGLPLDAYYLYVEYPGKYSRFTAVWIDEQNPVQEAVCLELFDHNVTGIEEKTGAQIRITGLFPNPVVSDLRVSIIAFLPGHLRYRIMDVTGMVHYTGSLEYRSGSQFIPLTTGDIPYGLFLIDFQTPEGERIATCKLVKY